MEGSSMRQVSCLESRSRQFNPLIHWLILFLYYSEFIGRAVLKQEFLTGHKRKPVWIIRAGVTGHACEHHFKHIGNLSLESWLNTNQCNLQSLKNNWNFGYSRRVKIPQWFFFFFLNKRGVCFYRSGLLAMFFLFRFSMCLVWSNWGDHAAHSCPCHLFAPLLCCASAPGQVDKEFMKISIALRAILRLWHWLLI